jgi:hypothetical protein
MRSDLYGHEGFVTYVSTETAVTAFSNSGDGTPAFWGAATARHSKNVCAEVVTRCSIGCAVICGLAPLHRDGSPSLVSDVEQMSIRLPAGPAGSHGEPTIFIAMCEQPDRGVKKHGGPARQDTGPMPIPRSIRS